MQHAAALSRTGVPLLLLPLLRVGGLRRLAVRASRPELAAEHGKHVLQDPPRISVSGAILRTVCAWAAAAAAATADARRSGRVEGGALPPARPKRSSLA